MRVIRCGRAVLSMVVLSCVAGCAEGAKYHPKDGGAEGADTGGPDSSEGDRSPGSDAAGTGSGGRMVDGAAGGSSGAGGADPAGAAGRGGGSAGAAGSDGQGLGGGGATGVAGAGGGAGQGGDAGVAPGGTAGGSPVGGSSGSGGATCSSGTMMPAVPVLGRPVSGHYTGSLHAPKMLGTLRPAFTWSKVPVTCQSVSYQVQLDDSCSPGALATCAFSSPEVDVAGLSSPSYTPPQDLKVSSVAPVGAFYAWRVRACDGANRCSSWSEVRYLHVGRVREDVNGDGYGDLLGCVMDDTDLEVFLGGPQFDVATPAVHVTAISGSMNSRFTGDVNGDGFGDFLAFQGYAPTSGSVPVVFLGAPNVTNLSSIVLTKDAGGSSANLGAGLSGDWNGDGFADVIISWSYLITNSSQLRVHFGGLSINPSADLHLDSPYTTTSAPGINDGGLVGDLNGDGIDDMGMFVVDYSGKSSRISVFLGGETPHVLSDLVLPQTAASSGSLARAGDLDQDGFDDIVVSLRATSYGVLRGASVLGQQDFMTRASADVGLAVAGFDLNGNGKPEFVLNQVSDAKIFEGATLDTVFRDLPSGTCTFVASSDYDGDGHSDLLAECNATELKLCEGDGTLAPLCKYVAVGRVVR